MRFATALVAVLGFAFCAHAQNPKDPPFPRRVLFVHIADYLYLNPLTHAAPGGPDRTRDAAAKLALGLRIPTAKDNDQLFVVSDTSGPDAALPTKDVLAKALDGFCATTRGQDRVVIYFGVHALAKDGKAFVVPIDGAPEEPTGLLPVADVYAKVKELRAAQKVVIWDVCRHNLGRVRGRHEPGPMTPELFKALSAAPEGVQVLVSCSPGESSVEFFAPRGPAGGYPGSAYLDALLRAAADDRAAHPKAAPDEALPIKALHGAAAKYVAGVAKQAPVLAGSAPERAPAYDPKEAPAKRFAPPAAPKGGPGADVRAVLDELALPPLVDGTDVLPRLVFPEGALSGYAPDATVEEILRNGDKYPLRVATLRALQTVRDAWPLNGKEQRAVAALPGPLTDRTKKLVTDAQQPVALAIVRLEVELINLEAQEKHRAKETKRWRAHYDFATAEVRLRLVILNDNNRALGRVKTETLPDLAGGATGWHLVPGEKVESGREARLLFAAAGAGFARVAADHKGTPWEVLAKRSATVQPGARWEPVAPLGTDGK